MTDCNPQSACQAMSTSDDALLIGLRNASSEACEALYDRYADALYHYALVRLLGDRQSAEDVLAQTLTDAVRNITQYNTRKSPLAAWLFGIARQHIRIQLRKRRRLKSVPAASQISLEAVSDVPDTHDLAASVSARLDAQQQFTLLAAALSDQEMEALTLQEVEQLTLKEIGKIMGRSERAVHSLLHRARQKARERLGADET